MVFYLTGISVIFTVLFLTMTKKWNIFYDLYKFFLYLFKAPVYVLIIPLGILYFFAFFYILSHIRIWQRRLDARSVRLAPTWWWGVKKALKTLHPKNWGYLYSGLSFILLCNLGPLLFLFVSIVKTAFLPICVLTSLPAGVSLYSS